MIKREYIDRQPRAGDTIEATGSNTYEVNRYSEGTEMIVTKLDSDGVFAYNTRTDSTVYIHDGGYRIYADVEYEKVGVDVIEKKFLGITYRREVIEKWQEVSE